MNLYKDIILNWELNIRTKNILIEEGITTLNDLILTDPNNLLKIPKFGIKSLDDITYFLNNEDLILNDEIMQWARFLNLKKINFEFSGKQSKVNEFLLSQIEQLKISKALMQELKSNGIKYIGDLLIKNEKEIKQFLYKENFDELNKILLNKKLPFGLKLSNWKQKTIEKNLANLIKEKDKNISEIKKILNINILKEWPLNHRCKWCFKKENIIYLGDLVNLNEHDLKKIKNLGSKSLVEINTLLNKVNLKLGTNTYDWERPIENSMEPKKYFVLKKTLFKNYEEIKKIMFKNNKIFINLDMSHHEVENLIIEDIFFIINLFTDEFQKIFKHRFAFETHFMTLEELGNFFSVTRERIRQKENLLYENIKYLGKIHKLSLVKYLLQNEEKSFHKIFPNLAIKFNNTFQSAGKFFNTQGDSLIFFLESFCDVDHGFFKTPETILMNFDKEKIKNIFIESKFPILKEFFLEELKKNYGYSNLVANSAFEYMKEKKIIVDHNNSISPYQISKNLEVSNILLDHPAGLSWKEIMSIGNSSKTKNKWDLTRKVGDSSLTMQYNPYIFLSKRGNYKHIKYLNFIDKKDDIIDFFISEIKQLNKKQVIFDLIFNKLIKDKNFQTLDFFEARAIIKIFGEEKGLYHLGASGQNTLSIAKNVKALDINSEILNFINDYKKEITINYLEKIFNTKTLNTKLNNLVEELKIFKINPGVFINFNDGLNLCDINEIEKKLKEIIQNYIFLTSDFIREFLNDSTGLNLSSLYYQSIYKIIAIKNKWYVGYNYLSCKKEKTSGLEIVIKNLYDNEKDIKENFKIISSQIGISRKTFDTIIYNNKLNFDLSWVTD